MTESNDFRPEDLGHPRGTLAIVIIYGLLFGLAWLGMYLYVFLPRGLISVPRGPTPAAVPSGDSAPAGGLRTPQP
jgi:hypothetical protein